MLKTVPTPTDEQGQRFVDFIHRSLNETVLIEKGKAKFGPNDYTFEGNDWPKEFWEKIWKHSEAFAMAPMFVAYRRYADDLRNVHPNPTHRIHALSLDWNPINIAQDHEDVVDAMVHYILGNNRRLRAFTWDELPTVLKDRLCKSSVFPIGEQKSQKWLDENVEWADIQLIMPKLVFDLFTSRPA